MTCPSPQALAAWRTGSLPGPEQAALEAHVAGCARCAAALEQPLRDEAPTAPAGDGAGEPVRPGQRIDRYVVLWELGRGGMGAVYAAFDPQLDRKVALKLLLPDPDRVPGADPGQAQARLLREAQALARVSHPHSVAVFDVGTHHGQVFLAMEHLEGATLKAWVKAQPRSWREIVDVVAQAGAGLAAVHAAGLVHRDFKPGNVIVTPSGQAKVLDFGLARLAQTPAERGLDDTQGEASGEPASDRLGEALTQVGSICGTPGYLAPELLLGGAPTPSTDQFAFGVTLYQCLYGRRPFGRASHASELPLLQAGLAATPPEGSEVPAWVYAIVRRCLAPQAAERFPDLTAALAALALDPGQKRRERLRWAVGATLVLTALAATWELRPGTTCPSAAELEARAFPAGQRALLEARLGPSGKPLLTQLERIVKDWALQSVEACAEAGQTPPPPLALQRRDCLERRGLGVTGVIEAVGMVEGALERHAADTVELMLGDVSCRWPEQYSRKTADEVLPGQRALARRLRSDVLRTSALAALGREADALALAQQTRERATDAGLVGFEAEADYQVAAQELVQGLEAQSVADYQRAFAHFLEAGIDDRAVIACGQWVRQTADRTDTLPAARAMLAVCEALWARLGRSRSQEYSLLVAQSAVAGAEGDDARRLALCERRVALSVELFGEESRFTAQARGTLATALWAVGDVSRSNREDEQALALFTRLNGPDDPALIARYISLATGLRHEGRRAEAMTLLEKGRALITRLGDATSSLGADVDLALADTCLGADDARALQLSTSVVTFYEGKQNTMELASALSTQADALAALGRGEEALAVCRRLGGLLPSLADPDGAWRDGRTLCEAEARTVLGQPAAALALYEAAAKGKPGEIPDDEGHQHFAHAQAVRAAHGDPARAEVLARQALAEYSVFPGFEAERKKIEAFLATPRAPRR